MKKNRVQNPAKFLADIVRDERSPAYRELCAISTDENGLQSNNSAAHLRIEIESVLADLLKGKFDAINQKIAQHTRKAPPSISIQPLDTKRKTLSADFYSTVKQVRVGENLARLETALPNSATPQQLLYGVLLRALESGDIQHLAVCRNCGKIFYRKSLKGRFCCEKCRWNFNNHSEERKARYIKGKWYQFPKETNFRERKTRS